MANPQQPELRRSERGAATDTATKERLTSPSIPGVDGPGGRVPEADLPGHHPAKEQDKPPGRDFVAKMHALAEEEAYVPPSAEDEVLDLTQIEADTMHTGAEPSDADHSKTAEVLANLAGKPFELVGAALSVVRKALPGD